MDLDARKRSLRERMRAVRRGIDHASAESAASSAAGRLASLPEFQGARRVALYAATREELSTRPLFEAILAAGKPALFPVMDKAAKRLGFERVRAWEELRRGGAGVLEPEGAAIEPLATDDLVVVPGVAFDRAGNRLGRGGGWFDRTFPLEPGGGPILVGYAFEVQMVETVPHGPGDRAMAFVVTDAATYRPARPGPAPGRSQGAGK